MSQCAAAEPKICPYCKEDITTKWRHEHCPKCGSLDHVVRNYDPTWRDGDVHCKDCGAYVRGYDAG